MIPAGGIYFIFDKQTLLRTSIRATINTSFVRLDQLKGKHKNEVQRDAWVRIYSDNLSVGVADARFKDPVSC